MKNKRTSLRHLLAIFLALAAFGPPAQDENAFVTRLQLYF